MNPVKGRTRRRCMYFKIFFFLFFLHNFSLFHILVLLKFFSHFEEFSAVVVFLISSFFFCLFAESVSFRSQVRMG